MITDTGSTPVTSKFSFKKIMPILKCNWCSKDFLKVEEEYNRQVRKGRLHFFCSRSCAAKKNNSTRKRILTEKICPYCKSLFFTLSGKKSASFCSMSCASRGSMSKKRQKAQFESGKRHSENLIPPEETLYLRESWKYTELISFLKSQKEPFKFEYRIGRYIYDLALLKQRLFIEFDGLYHNGSQLESDLKKDEFAKKLGWKVIRKRVGNNTVINPDLLSNLY